MCCYTEDSSNYFVLLCVTVPDVTTRAPSAVARTVFIVKNFRLEVRGSTHLILILALFCLKHDVNCS
jgi:hypothetical protein